MDLPHRKQNRLKNFDYGEQGCYFVTLCTQKRQRLFEMESVPSGDRRVNEPIQNRIVHKCITETESKFPNSVFEKYIIMPDHLHFIINIKERHTGRSLQDVMRFFKTKTTNEYIDAVKKNLLPPFDGKVWQKSYYDHIIRNQIDYNEIWEYIENNPLKASRRNQSP